MLDKKIVTGVKHKSHRTVPSFFPKQQGISANENNSSSTDPIQILNLAEVANPGKWQIAGGGVL